MATPAEDKKDTPKGGLAVRIQPSSRAALTDISRDLFPNDVDAILTAADTGDNQKQSYLSKKILEKDGDILTAVQTRQAALVSTPFEIIPALHDDSDKGKEIAVFCDNYIRSIPGDPDKDLGNFSQLLNYMSTAILPGFSLSEIVWQPGGGGVDGFQFIPQHNFTFKDSMRPRLLLAGENDPKKLVPNKWVFHRYQYRNGDLATGGLIRPLAYIYSFRRMATIDMLRYVEKFGMPFVAAKIADNLWEDQKNKIASLVSNFSSDGGGVFSESVELEFITPSNGGQSPYQQVLDHFERLVTRIILGQELSTSTGGGGSFALGQVHEQVRQDLRASDCEAISASVRSSLLRPIVAFNFGTDAPVPIMEFQLDPPINMQRDGQAFASLSQGLAALAQAGIEADLDILNKRFGFGLKRMEIMPQSEGNTPNE